MALTCKWITDEAGPLVCGKAEASYSWSICASGAECTGALSAHTKWPQTKAIALVESNGRSTAARRAAGQSSQVSVIPRRAGKPTARHMPDFVANTYASRGTTGLAFYTERDDPE
jgi:hypothetical protein